MTKREATRIAKALVRNGWHDTEIIKWQTGGWSVYATDNATGYRLRFDNVSRAEAKIADYLEGVTVT